MSIAFDRAAGYYDQTRGFPPGVEELVADRIEEAVGPAGRLLEVGAVRRDGGRVSAVGDPPREAPSDPPASRA